MQIRWSHRAASDLEDIFAYIARDNPTAARDTVRTIYDACSALQEFPQRGRPSRLKGRRELVIAAYIVVYRETPHGVQIAHVYHQARNWH